MPTGPRTRRRVVRETELYAPIRDYLTKQGYTVRGEVKSCDIAAVKGDDLILIELKRSFSAELLFQATRRQRLSVSVYVAVPRHDALRSRARWRGIKHLARRLELGLILVDLDVEPPWVDVTFHPTPLVRRKDARAKRALLEEVQGRSTDLNEGGSTRQKLVTAYREKAIFLACCLDAFGPLSTRQLRALGGGPKGTSILYSNVYGWFERVSRGMYGLHAEGKTALTEYPELVERFRDMVAQHPDAPDVRSG
jgi:hypothetical protein